MTDNVRFLPNPESGDEGTHIALTSGHACRVYAVGPDGKKGTWIPQMFRKHAVAIGCGIVGIDEPKAPEVKKETRTGLIVEAIAKLVEENNSEKLQANGRPTIEAVKEAAGFNVTKKMYDDAWGVFTDSLDD